MKLLCVCVTIGENPLIRYHRPLDDKQTINRKIPEHLTRLVQAELDAFCATNPEFPVSRKYIIFLFSQLISTRSHPEILHFLVVH